MTTPTTVQVKLQLRADTAANWTSINPTLLANELGRETDTGKIKIGNGSTAWNSLAYQAWATLPIAVNVGGTGQTTYTNGQLLIGNTTGNTLTKATLTAGAGVAITNGTGTITVAVSGIVDAQIAAGAEIAVSKLADGTPRQLLQTDAAGTGVEWASNIDVPGTLDVTGAATFDNNVIIQGDLTVNGTETIINTQTLEVEDKNIIVGKVTTPTDITADGGGITLKGTTDKTINWIDSTDAWTLSEHISIASAKEYRIAGTKVLDATSLGSAVVSSSLTSVGTIGTGTWQGTTVATGYGGTGQTTYSNGQLLIGKTDGTLAKATLTAGTGITVTNADGSISIASTATGTVTAVTGTSPIASTGGTTPDISIQDGTTAQKGAVQLEDSTSSTSTTKAATPASVKTAYDLANAALPKAGGTITGNLEIGTAGSISFEGATANDFETTLAVVDPTADRTITLPDITGTIVTTGDTGTVTSTMILDGTIVDGDINASAAIVDTKLATISTAGKVSNSATTATDVNTASAIVARDGSGNFTAGTITAALTGAASSNVLKAGDTMTGALAVTAGTAALPGLAVSGDLNTGIYSPGADQLAVATNGVGRLFVDASGNVGVGVSPAARLHVYGTYGYFQDGTYDGYFGKGNGVVVGAGASDLGISSATGAIVFGTGASLNERLRITSAGLVGIGTSSPGAKAEIRQDGNTAVELVRLVNDDTSGAGSTILFKNYYNSALISSTSTPGLSLGGSLRLQTYNDTNTLNTGLVMNNQGRVGIGTTSPNSNGLVTIYEGSGAKLYLSDGQLGLTYGARLTGGGIGGDGSYAELGVVDNNIYNKAITVTSQANNIVFGKGATEKARIDSSGRLLVGTSTARTSASHTGSLQLEGTTFSASTLSVIGNASDSSGAYLHLGKARGGSIGSTTVVADGDTLGQIHFTGSDGTSLINGAIIAVNVDGTPGANDMPSRLVFSTTADGASSPTERMRITSAGNVFLASAAGTTIYPGENNTANGFMVEGPNGKTFISTASVPSLSLNRNVDDGVIVSIRQAGTEEGSISVSGTTVSYNGAHLSRWSQLPGGTERTEILRGTVLSNLDEMCEWGEEDNEQLNRMKVSDVEGDKNVSGVFQTWDDDDDTYTNDFYCAMTGDFIIRIAEGVTVERGDLLMSAGDGTAKPQDDDIIRSKTIAKVTSTNVSCTYDDGSYCVPCVLMAC